MADIVCANFGGLGVSTRLKDLGNGYYAPEVSAILEAGTVTIGAIAGSHTPSDAYANPTDAINALSLSAGWDGTNWDRQRTSSAANNQAASTAAASWVSNLGIIAQEEAPNWVQNSAPAVGTLASTSRAAGATGVKHICTGFILAYASDGTANGAGQNVTAVLRDGATGAGTILIQHTFGRTTLTPTDFINQGSFEITGLSLTGTAATAMTLEFIGTASNHEFYTATLMGYSVV